MSKDVKSKATGSTSESESMSEVVDESTIEQRETGVASTVYRAKLKKNSESWIAIKSASSNRRFSPEPHDILKEIAIISSISHGNIIDVVGSRRTSAIVELWTPWIRYNLENLLDLPTFSPSRVPTEINHLTLNPADDLDPPSKADRFQIVTKAIIYQIILALEYLHGLDLPIGHRDIKPRNVLLTASGCVKLIDFGIAFHERLNSRTTNLWPETTENMYNDVSTGPFRAPELLFGPRTYDACATDLWSLGCTIAHFFTPIRLLRKSYYDEDEDDLNASDEDAFPDASGFVLPKDLGSITFRTAEWMRLPLFDGRQGSIGLVWSIFKLRGTPNSEIWPNFDALPDANKVEFKVVPSVDLLPYMPNLPFGTGSTGSAHAPPTIIIPSPLDLIHRLLVYPPETRIKASDALMHPWFLSAHDVPLILPTDHPQARKDASPGNTWETTWHGKEMEHWLSMEFRRR